MSSEQRPHSSDKLIGCLKVAEFSICLLIMTRHHRVCLPYTKSIHQWIILLVEANNFRNSKLHFVVICNSAGKSKKLKLNLINLNMWNLIQAKVSVCRDVGYTIIANLPVYLVVTAEKIRPDSWRKGMAVVKRVLRQKGGGVGCGS